MKKIRVLIADDHSIVRIGLADLLSDEGSFDVIGTAKNGEEALSMTEALHPDVVIIDLVMPKMDGRTATERIKAQFPETAVMLLTSFSSSDGIAGVLKAGATGAILKNAENDAIIETLKRVAAGEIAISADIRRIIREDPPLPNLSPRQKEILESITRGLTNTDIANQLGISVTSVKTHMEALFAKIGASNRSEAVAIALRKHLLKI